MSESCGGIEPQQEDAYQAICAAMQPGLLITVNESAPHAISHGELTVLSVDDDGTVELDGPRGGNYRITHSGERGAAIETVDEEGFGFREEYVQTIEIVGIGDSR